MYIDVNGLFILMTIFAALYHLNSQTIST